LKIDNQVLALTIKDILETEDYSRGNIISLLEAEGNDKTLLYKRSSEIKENILGIKFGSGGL